jgi:cytochrome b561
MTRPAVYMLAVVATLFGAGPALAAERMATNQDSNAALLMLFVIMFIAIGLATAKRKHHKAGIISAGIGLLAGAVTLLWANQTGQFDHFKPPVTPLDYIKSPLLLAQAALAALVGLFLVHVGIKMPVPAIEERTIRVGNDAASYGRVSRILHWSIAIIFISLIPIGIFMSGLPEGTALREPLYIIHKSLGMTLLLLVVGRIIWHITNKPPALTATLTRSNRMAAKSAHILLYALMIGFPITGYFMSSFAGKIVPFFYFDLPVWLAPSKDNAMPFGLLHKFALPILFYLTFFAHVSGVLWHHFRDRDTQAIKRIAG